MADKVDLVQRRRGVASIAVFIAGLILSLTLYAVVRDLESRQVRAEFYLDAELIVSSVRNQVERAQNHLRAIAAFFSSSDYVNRDEFRNYVKHMLEGDTSIKALEWIPRVASGQRNAFENEAEGDGFPGFSFTEKHAQGVMVPAAPRAEYFPVFYVEPIRGNERALGFDQASDHERREALRRSMDIGKAVATAPVELVQDKEQSRGFLLFYPVYEQDTVSLDVETRRNSLGGFALGVFRVRDMVSMALKILDRRDINVQISDDEAARYLHRHWAASGQPNDYQNISVLHQQTVLVGGRKWTCMASPSQGYLGKRQTWNPIAIALIGIGVSLFLAGYLGEKERAAQSLQQMNESLEQRVARRTREIEDRNRELARSNESLSQFAYVASHDLQEPLRAMHGYSQILSGRYSKQLDEKAQGFIGNIVDGVDRMKTLISGLLNYSKIGGVHETFTEFDTGELIEQVIQDLATAIEESGSEVIHNGLPSLVAERIQLGQLFQNLIGNGIKFRNSKRTVVEIAAARSETSDRSEALPPGWVFSVTDNGIGIEPQYLDSIFIIFKRLHDRTEYRGTGIGLAICKRIVEYHNGRIWVASEPGQGTTFFFDIPDRELA